MSGKDATTPKRPWRETLAVYFQWPMMSVFLLGIASGFPLLLTSSTLAARMTESGIDIKTIGIFALVGLPYTLKFLCAPLVDALKLPKIQTHLAHRKSWCILTQILLTASLVGMACTDPAQNIGMLGIFALATATFSAMQDIVIDALRVEILPKDAQGAAAAASVAGYRIGMLLAGAGAFVLATFMSWNTVYLIGAGVMALCIAVTLTIRRLHGVEEAIQDGRLQENLTAQNVQTENQVTPNPQTSSGYQQWLYTAVIAPIVDFMKRPAAILILLFIALFKLGDAMAGTLSVPFYLHVGFTKIEIAAVTKVIGVAAVLGGTFIGGFIVKRYKMMHALLICGTLQLLSNFVFVWLSYIGASVPALTVCICVENISGGMGTAAFVAYMAQLCNIRFTATQYALLSSLSSVGRTLLSSSAGFIAAGLGWAGFFITTAAMGLPGMILLVILMRSEQSNPNALK
jgi:PAT family beta-lactamase induction signal transducer AmpG